MNTEKRGFEGDSPEDGVDQPTQTKDKGFKFPKNEPVDNED